MIRYINRALYHYDAGSSMVGTVVYVRNVAMGGFLSMKNSNDIIGESNPRHSGNCATACLLDIYIYRVIEKFLCTFLSVLEESPHN